jgi:hypothetical protein
LTGVTYAWFSQSDFATVSDMEIAVESRDGGVYISTKPYEDFGTTIDIPVPKDAKGDNVKFNPASTAGILTSDGKLKFFNGSLESPTDDTMSIEAIAAPGAYYIEQEVYFDNSTGSGDLIISLKDTVIASTNENRAIQAATRVAVVTHGSLTKEQFDVKKLTGEAYPLGTPTVQILETNPTEHTSLGISEYKLLTGKTSVGANETFAYYYGVNDVTAEGVEINRYNKKVNSGDPDISQLTKLSHNADKTATILRATPDDVEIIVPAYSYLKTIVYIWIEGQDPDCQNNVSGTPYVASIRFTKKGMMTNEVGA